MLSLRLLGVGEGNVQTFVEWKLEMERRCEPVWNPLVTNTGRMQSWKEPNLRSVFINRSAGHIETVLLQMRTDL